MSRVSRDAIRRKLGPPFGHHLRWEDLLVVAEWSVTIYVGGRLLSWPHLDTLLDLLLILFTFGSF